MSWWDCKQVRDEQAIVRRRHEIARRQRGLQLEDLAEYSRSPETVRMAQEERRSVKDPGHALDYVPDWAEKL